jgi:hypothetical protein
VHTDLAGTSRFDVPACPAQCRGMSDSLAPKMAPKIGTADARLRSTVGVVVYDSQANLTGRTGCDFCNARLGPQRPYGVGRWSGLQSRCCRVSSVGQVTRSIRVATLKQI